MMITNEKQVLKKLSRAFCFNPFSMMLVKIIFLHLSLLILSEALEYKILSVNCRSPLNDDELYVIEECDSNDQTFTFTTNFKKPFTDIMVNYFTSNYFLLNAICYLCRIRLTSLS